MDKYTMGTCGGPRDDANFAAWQQCNKSHVVHYTNHPLNLYLSVFHSWGKQFGYPFVSFKDPLPLQRAIDSFVEFSSGIGDEFDDDIGRNALNETGTNQQFTGGHRDWTTPASTAVT